MDKAETPWHLWVVGLLALLWNGFGANDYLQTQRGNAEYIDAMTENLGVATETVLAYYDSFPAWADAFWAIGVWGAVLGSILLLLRSRFAFHAFLASLAGLVVTTIYQFGNPMPAMNTVMPFVMMGVIYLLTFALIYYAKRMTARGVLR